MATIQQQEEEADEEEGSVMLTIVPNEDGEMVAVPVRVQQSGEEDGEGDEDGSKTMEVHMDDGDGTEFQVCNLLADKYLYVSFRSFSM